MPYRGRHAKLGHPHIPFGALRRRGRHAGGCRKNVASAAQSGRARAADYGPICPGQPGRSCGLAQRVLR
eukprot:2667890-Prymnesium_polylepis.1